MSIISRAGQWARIRFCSTRHCVTMFLLTCHRGDLSTFFHASLPFCVTRRIFQLRKSNFIPRYIYFLRVGTFGKWRLSAVRAFWKFSQLAVATSTDMSDFANNNNVCTKNKLKQKGFKILQFIIDKIKMGPPPIIL